VTRKILRVTVAVFHAIIERVLALICTPWAGLACVFNATTLTAIVPVLPFGRYG
jgi:hypothetical protein